MLQHDRFVKIREVLNGSQAVSTRQLSDILGTSVVTVRKDLDAMARAGIVSRTHGGAILTDFSHNAAAVPPEKVTSDNLDTVAELAKSFVCPGDFIFLGSGRTCLLLADKIKAISNISVITNNISALYVLKPYVENIVLLGGEVVSAPSGLLATCDSHLEVTTNGMFVNKAFSSGVGIDTEAGLTVNNILSTYVTRIIPQLSDEWYVLMDSDKFGVRAFYQAADLRKISHLVTDVTDPSILSKYQSRGVDVIHPPCR